jgi:hypothetical protein
MTYVRQRNTRMRKAPVAVRPRLSAEAGPPDPHPIEQPAVLPTGLNEAGQPRGGHQYYPGRDTIAPPGGIPRNIPDPMEGYDEDIGDIGDILRSRGAGRTVSVHLPTRHLEVLSWAAQARGQTVEQLAEEMLRAPLAGLRSDFQRSRTGGHPGTVRRSELGKFIGEE